VNYITHTSRIQIKGKHSIANRANVIECASYNFQLIPWSRINPEKLTVAQLVKKFPKF